MTKASDNAFPSILITEGTEPSAPSAGTQRLYIDSTTHKLKRTDSSGTDVTIEGASPSGSITSSGYTQNTARLLGRTTASSGAVEEITVGTGLSLSAGSLTATGGAAGALTFLEAHTASTSATLDFTTFISSTYDNYLIEIVNLHLATNNVNFLMRVGTGGGPTYDTGSNYAWSSWRMSNSGQAGGGSAGTTSFGIDGSGGILNSANYGLSGTITLFDPQAATYKRIIGHLSYHDASSAPLSSFLTGAYLSTTALTAIRFLASSGNITDGTIRIYGYAKS